MALIFHSPPLFTGPDFCCIVFHWTDSFKHPEIHGKMKSTEVPRSPGTWSFLAGLGEADTCGGRDWGGGGEDMRGQPCLQPQSQLL